MPLRPVKRAVWLFAPESCPYRDLGGEGAGFLRNVLSGGLDVGAGAASPMAASVARKSGIKVLVSPAPKFASTLTAHSSIKTLQDPPVPDFD